jgi:hypothetical protein
MFWNECSGGTLFNHYRQPEWVQLWEVFAEVFAFVLPWPLR